VKIVVFGLTVSSSWGNGHATLWRGLIRALTARGHRVVFFERDTEYYAGNRDLHELAGGALVLYPDWESVRARAVREVAESDVSIVTSYCPRRHRGDRTRARCTPCPARVLRPRHADHAVPTRAR
jgi:spore maturation protein CgeB